MKCIHLCVFIFALILPSISSRHVQFYRKDYTYIKEYDAFYKIHWDLNGSSWNSAFLTCDDEGATLFYPKVKGEWALVQNLTNKMAVVPNVTDIFVGIHDEFGLSEFITVDGLSTPFPLLAGNFHNPYQDNCIIMNIDTGLFRVDTCTRIPDSPLPFVCKRVDNESCPTVDHDYKYAKVLRKCYKVNKKPKMWQEAMQTCFMEGGILTVIENSAEADVVKEMTNSGETYFVGVRRIFSQSDLYSVKGQKISELYQERYNDNDNDNSDCGVVYMDGSLRTMTADCGHRLPFICEMEVDV